MGFTILCGRSELVAIVCFTIVCGRSELVARVCFTIVCGRSELGQNPMEDVDSRVFTRMLRGKQIDPVTLTFDI